MNSSQPDDFIFNSTGYEDIGFELSTLISTYPPAFVYIHDSSDGIKVNAQIIANLLNKSSEPSSQGYTTKVCCGWANAACCFTQRLLFEMLIHSLVGHNADWDNGCANWMLEHSSQWNENLDSFLQGLRGVHAHLCKTFGVDSTEVDLQNCKGKRKEQQYNGVRIVLVVAQAERLKESMPELLVSLSRLRELARLDLCVLLCSDVEWDLVKPPLGAAPDPYFIDIRPLTKEDTIDLLVGRYSALTSEHPILYHPSLKTLYSHFIAVLCDVCYLYTHDPSELQYIAAARWPGFVKPVLDEHQSQMDSDGESEEGQRNIEPPSEDVRLRLTRIFSSSLSLALESLYPRLTDASAWAKANEPSRNLLSIPPTEAKITTTNSTSALGAGPLLSHLPRLSKFILVASFLASTNPAKSDIRMFGRGLDEKKRRRRKAPLKPKGGVSKIPQRLLGPSPFPLERLIALLGALLEEHDVESRLLAPEFTIPGEYTDMEISRVAINAAVQELSSSRLMHRMTKAEQIDGPAMFKCAISYDLAWALSKELKIPLPDLLWEQV